MLILFAGNNAWLANVFHWLNGLDQRVFIYINRIFSNSFFDNLLPVWREAQTWYPLYLFLLAFTLINFGKKAWLWILFFALTIALCDQLSSAIIKDFFARPRPCSDPVFSQYVRLLLNRCPSSGSFTSSHAVNHFGMATFIVHTLRSHLGRFKIALYLWAASICYAQVYVGVHYPLDVIAGALLGWMIGLGSAGFFNRRIGPLTLTDSLLKNRVEQV